MLAHSNTRICTHPHAPTPTPADPIASPTAAAATEAAASEQQPASEGVPASEQTLSPEPAEPSPAPDAGGTEQHAEAELDDGAHDEVAEGEVHEAGEGEQQDDFPAEPQQPPSVSPPPANTQDEQPPVILITTVDIGEGQNDTIELRKGGDPTSAARAFCEKHGLPPHIVAPLTQHILDNLSKAKQVRGRCRECSAIGTRRRTRTHSIREGEGQTHVPTQRTVTHTCARTLTLMMCTHAHSRITYVQAHASAHTHNAHTRIHACT